MNAISKEPFFALLIASLLAQFFLCNCVQVEAKNTVSRPINFYLDHQGKIAVRCPSGAKFGNFHDGVALCDDEKVSFIDRSGNKTISTQYKYAHDFSEGLAACGERGKMGFIDTKGVVKIPPIYEMAMPFSEGLAPVKINGKCGFIDKTGKLVIDALFDNAACFSEGFAPVDVEGMVGFIDKNGAWKIKPQFICVQGFSSGVALVSIYCGNPRAKYINKLGDTIAAANHSGLSNSHDTVESFSGLYASNSERFGSMLGDNGSFQEGLAPVRRTGNGQFGYINAAGRFVIEPKFDRAYPFSEDRALVWSDENRSYGFIDKAGNLVIPCKFQQATDFSEGLAAVSIAKDKWGYIDKTGRFVIEPVYWIAYPFSEGLGHVTTADPCTCESKKKR